MTVAAWDNDPLVPLTVTVKLPETDPVHDSVEFADPPFGGVAVVGLRLQVRPAEGVIASVRLTALLNPFRLPKLRVEFPETPMVTELAEGLALIVKSGPAATV